MSLWDDFVIDWLLGCKSVKIKKVCGIAEC